MIADAESVCSLVREILQRYIAPDKTDVTRWRNPKLSEPPNFRKPSIFARALGNFPSRIARDTKSARPHVGTQEISITAAPFFPWKRKTLGLDRGITILEGNIERSFSCAPHEIPCSPDGEAGGSKEAQEIALGCVVNTRRSLGISSGEEFGVFLGSFVVTHEVPKRIGLTDLARAIRLQTERIKDRKLYLDSAFEAVFASLMFSFFLDRAEEEILPQALSVWGGITNMNLNTLWPRRPGEPGWDYCRTVSTGPATPLVLSITTVADRVNIGVSYRNGLFGA